MSKVIDSWWFNTIGIVKVLDETTNEEKFYIGYGYGFDEKQDIEMIKNLGTKFYPEQIK